MKQSYFGSKKKSLSKHTPATVIESFLISVFDIIHSCERVLTENSYIWKLSATSFVCFHWTLDKDFKAIKNVNVWRRLEKVMTKNLFVQNEHWQSEQHKNSWRDLCQTDILSLLDTIHSSWDESYLMRIPYIKKKILK